MQPAQTRQILSRWISQQADLGMPDLVLSPGLRAELGAVQARDAVVNVRVAAKVSGGAATQSAPPEERQATQPRRRAIKGLRAPDMPALSTSPAPSVAQSGAARDMMAALYRESLTCAECPLAQSRHKVVFGAGNVQAPLMIIGEAPGADEDAQGLPFVGAAGMLLDKMLGAIGLDRTRDVFITNVLKCRPPENRDPDSVEVIKCTRILFRQIEIMAPKALLLLGRVAAGTVLRKNDGIGKLRTQEHEYQGITAFVTYHPAAMLRSESYKRPAWEDLKRLKAFMLERGYYNGVSA